ncbi:MAG TPA: hypothetical protein VGR47_03715 [Terracidiphilus sp.]|nr:hypothetical protein [Terracidiphilus sp.]
MSYSRSRLIKLSGLAVTLIAIFALSAPVAIAQSTSSPAAYVYVQIQGRAGSVYGFQASSAGKLNVISGSPFKPSGLIIGGNGSELVTLGQDNLYSYGVASDGTIQSQLESVPYVDYSGGECGGGTSSVHDAVLDHTGKYVYIMLDNGTNPCAAYQSFAAENAGVFDFAGFTEQDTSGGAEVDLPSILGNETFAYADLIDGHSSSLIGFQRNSSGALQLMKFAETDPTLSGGTYSPLRPDASPTGNYLVVQLYPNDSNPPQLASYTVDSQGNISTTNTSGNMPTSALEDPYSTFSPSGNLIAFYADNGPTGTAGNGIEIYNFNGAAPLTLNTTLLTGVPIDQVEWDNSNHLYVISKSVNTIYVYTVTPTSVTEDMTQSLGAPFHIVVVSQTAPSGACTPPSDGINVCSPDENATLNSPVNINAAAALSGGVYRFELWNGSTKLLTERNTGIMDQSLPLSAGSYHLIFDAYNTAGVHEYASRDITVTTGGTCPAPSSDGINVCSPTEGTVPCCTFSVEASAVVTGGVYRFELWANGTKVYTVRDSGVMDTSIHLVQGSYTLTFVAYNTAGEHVYKTVNITTE